MMPPTIDAVWMGRKLGPVHAGCLASFVRVGHRTVLYAFDEIEDVPQGVESFDASRLMAADEIIRHRRTSSLALASDIYRYRILRENLGIYVDRDILCLGPFPDVDYLFGCAGQSRQVPQGPGRATRAARVDIDAIAKECRDRIEDAIANDDICDLLTLLDNKGILADAARRLRANKRNDFEGWLTRVMGNPEIAPGVTKAITKVLPEIPVHDRAID